MDDTFEALAPADSVTTLAADASDLGFPPGTWPPAVRLPNCGEEVFRLRHLEKSEVAWEHEVLWADYATDAGRELRVFND